VNELKCPRCQVVLSRWRAHLRPGILDCVACGARLTLSRDSARAIGRVGGFALFAALAFSGAILGFDKLRTWKFIVYFLVFSLVLGQVIKTIFGVFVLKDDEPR
jgi:hypothetical protein